MSHRAYPLHNLLTDLPLSGLEAVDFAACLDPGVAPGHRDLNWFCVQSSVYMCTAPGHRGGELPLHPRHRIQGRLNVLVNHLLNNVDKITLNAVIKTIFNDIDILVNTVIDYVNNVCFIINPRLDDIPELFSFSHAITFSIIQWKCHFQGSPLVTVLMLAVDMMQKKKRKLKLDYI